ncbi:MAG: chromosome partitioning protein ParB [Candidatus Portnoybacteria bacterium CG03_land_8_20_14_0_80_41_10]|uniref:Chromosome partitioning protein ParB n=1 Tax=Candidatus Portnoybacteria bacterium CG03_land_8_20_14_0_80_41_10 TaxID=1974808 RepID=A0A2M7BUA1_9BACT|nr:MAG: chromosome partitioning protein ParB [Candidatus Portnoybacteria bacterium CG03_land_8_20_14_0_80_41_10]
MEQKLGQGLQSLIPKKQSKMAYLIKNESRKKIWLEPKKESIFNIEVDKIKPNPNQPRKEMSEENLKEMADSIKEHGILQPLIVTKIEKPTEWGRQMEYELIAGERRWRAAKIAGLPHVPVIIRDSSAYEKLELALVENLQRENLNPIEAAQAFKQLHQDFKLKHSQIAQKIGKSRVTVTNALRLLNLPPIVQKAMASGRISEGHGRAILMAKPTARLSLYRTIVKENLDVRRAEEKARQVAASSPHASGPKNILFKKKEKDLSEVLGRRVSITQRGGRGYLRIEFADQKELDKLVDYLLKF